MIKKFFFFILIFPTLISCTYEKRVRIESIDEQLKEISKNYEYVNNIRITYLAYTVFLKVDIQKEMNEFEEEKILDDLQTLLGDEDVQGKIEDYYFERYDAERLNKESPTLKIVFVSFNEDVTHFAYELYKKKKNNEYIYVEEWEGPIYDLEVGY